MLSEAESPPLGEGVVDTGMAAAATLPLDDLPQFLGRELPAAGCCPTGPEEGDEAAAEEESMAAQLLPPPPPSGGGGEGAPSGRVLDKEARGEALARLDALAEIGLPPPEALCVLVRFGWDASAAAEAWRGGRPRGGGGAAAAAAAAAAGAAAAAARAAAGLPPAGAAWTRPGRPDPAGVMRACPICLEPAMPGDLLALHCRHFFCRDCWGCYLATAVATAEEEAEEGLGGGGAGAAEAWARAACPRCPAQGCRAAAPGALLARAVVGEEAKERAAAAAAAAAARHRAAAARSFLLATRGGEEGGGAAAAAAGAARSSPSST